ncbi:MAG: tetratricopeptide repeat protein [Bacteroidota bacterium]|nr:tetratricopeptide repeat protein [Bacteroidota bacterium]
MAVKKNKKIRVSEKQPVSLVQSNERLNHFILALIVIFTVFLFAKSIFYQFVFWDDTYYVVENSLIMDLSPRGLVNIFTTPVLGMYNPIPFLVYAIEHAIWGLNPKVFHFFNILFHLIAAIVLYKFILRLTKRYETAAIVTLLFAIHPMHVGVVAWVSQTKTSIYFIFYILALSKYLRYIQDNYKIKNLVYVGIFFILSALSKPSAVTLAPMLFLFDYYLGRKLDKRLIIEKIPFFMISVFFGILTLMTHGESNDSIFNVNLNYSFINNLLIANYSVVFYINKFFVPIDLSAIYPYPDNTTYLPLKYYLSLFVIPTILWLVYKSGKFRKEMIFGLLFFSISISVLIRLVPTGFFSVANRYSYLSYTGLFFIIGQFFTYMLDNKFSISAKTKSYLYATFFSFVVFFSYRTTIRVSKWENSITLFDDVIKKSQKIPIAYNNRALAKLNNGDNWGALNDFSLALKLDTAYTEAYLNRGLINYNLGKLDEAMADYNKSLTFNPKLGAAFFNRALVKMKRKDKKGALEDLKIADSLDINEAENLIEQLSVNSPATNRIPNLTIDETQNGIQTEQMEIGSTQ